MKKVSMRLKRIIKNDRKDYNLLLYFISFISLKLLLSLL